PRTPGQAVDLLQQHQQPLQTVLESPRLLDELRQGAGSVELAEQPRLLGGEREVDGRARQLRGLILMLPQALLEAQRIDAPRRAGQELPARAELKAGRGSGGGRVE